MESNNIKIISEKNIQCCICKCHEIQNNNIKILKKNKEKDCTTSDFSTKEGLEEMIARMCR